MKCPVCNHELVQIKNEFGVVKVVMPCSECISGDEYQCPYQHSYSEYDESKPKTKTVIRPKVIPWNSI